NTITTLSSEKDANYIPHNGGGAPPAATLPNKKGLNRFVWDMHHDIVPGVPGVYIEAGFRGHTVIPGTYTAQFNVNGKTLSRDIVIQDNPKYNISKNQYDTYDSFMEAVESNVTEMHQKVNMLAKAREDISQVLKTLKEKPAADQTLIDEGNALLEAIKAWDEKMVQRRSQAYDDVENFENKFTAEYLFLINQSDSSIPLITEAAKNRKAELYQQWMDLRSTANALIQNKIPEYNKRLWNAGIGAISFE
ncbi:MAG: glycosyl hydrolase, partial [Marinirhabdus sp.]|nr:glycosyl hydrolase [Marinirhabdus sp.]